ncbi:RHS repeat-associated core domain-containing protein, partial [Pseudomonas sp. GM60]|uniref:RHS repeat-associated core domain-containing protein n=1 Tax=Pseudomonas sp. GM60 TaxID=1144334 RepID=UPI003082B986
VLMRFNGPDWFSPFGRGGLNSYAYCLGDPINLSDPNGTSPPFFKRMSGRPIYKSGPERPPNTPAKIIYTDVTTFTPLQETQPYSFTEATFRTKANGEHSHLVKSVIGFGYDEVSIETGGKIKFMRRKLTPDENRYSEMTGLDLESFYSNLELPEIPISLDHRNLLKARAERSKSKTVAQINTEAENGLLKGVRPSRAKILIRDPHFRFDGDRWWEKKRTSDHTIVQFYIRQNHNS